MKQISKGTLTVAFMLTACNNNGDKATEQNKVSEEPNILVFIVDDLGWTDLSCYGSKFYETPNIDSFAQKSVVFTHAYAPASVSSPSRASMLTGKNPARIHLTDWTGPDKWHSKGKLKTPNFSQHMELSEITLAEALHNNGYKTCFLGKWHVGAGKYLPSNQGFDVSIGASDDGGPPSHFYPYYNKAYEGTGWAAQLSDLAETGKKDEYLTDRLTNEAINFIDTVKSPFLVYLSHYAVHRPLEAKELKVEKYTGKIAKENLAIQKKYIHDHTAITNNIQNHPVYAGMIESIDESFGKVVLELRKKGILENTIIVFASDNGGLSTTKDEYIINHNEISTCNLPLRAGKGWLYEGGIRVPLIIGWKGHIISGKTSSYPVIGTDFYPTLLSLAGLELMPEQHKDGIDISSILFNNSQPKRESLFFHYPHYHPSGQTPASAVILGNYKLIHWYEGDSLELFNISEDISERNNLNKQMPEKTNELYSLLKEWLQDVGAQMIR